MRPVVLVLALALGALAGGGLWYEHSSSAAAALAAPVKSPPNVLLITTDDQTLEEMRWLPATSRLIGRRGVTFTEMVSPHPNCCPARAQILTGQYAHNNGVRTNGPPHGGHQAFTPGTALPVWLQNAGYATGFVGKYMHGYDQADPVEPGWDDWRPIIGPPLSNYTDLVQYANGQVVNLPPEAYHSDVVAGQASEMVRTFSGQDRPFFVWASFVGPHGTCVGYQEKNCSGPPPPAPRHAGLARDARLPSLDSPSFNERQFGDKPPQLRNSPRVDPAAMQQLYTARAKTLAAVDEGVQALVSALEESSELENTVILFTSDNGYLFGEHRQKGKILAYEESLSVPLLMRGPGIPSGERRHQTVAMIDLAPTIAEITGAQPLVRVDGHSAWDWAKRDTAQPDRALLVQAGSRAADPARAWQFRGVRTDRYTFVRWYRPRFIELYDRRKDPHQLRNIAGRPAYANVLTRMRRKLNRLGECSGRTCR